MVAGSDAAVSTRLTPAVRTRLRRAGRALLDRLGAAKGALLSRVPERFHSITDEVAKFGAIGFINLGVNFAVFNALLVLLHDSEVKAKAVAAIVATTSAYFLNRHWTYRHRPKSTLRREYSLFFFFNAVGLVIETAIVALAKYGFNETDLIMLNLCGFVGIALGTVFRFWAYRTHVFKDAEVAPAQVAYSGVVVPAATRIETAPIDTAPMAESPLADDDLRDELVQLELDQMLERGPVAADGTEPGNRH